MLQALLDILSSKKALAAIVGVVAQVAGHWGLGVDQTAVTTAISPLYLYILSQAITDHGKAAAQVTANTTTTASATTGGGVVAKTVSTAVSA